MQSSWKLGALAALSVFAAGQASAGPPTAFSTEARLVSAPSAPRAETIEGVRWTCDGDACKGAAERRANLDSPVKECKKVVAVLGAVTAYRTGPRDLTASQLRTCNRDAPNVQTAAK